MGEIVDGRVKAVPGHLVFERLRSRWDALARRVSHVATAKEDL